MKGLAPTLIATTLILAACTEGGPQRPSMRDDATPLDRYVAADDPAYSWEPIHDLVGEGYVTHVLRMTSGAWLTGADVDRTVWWHWLMIIEPETIKSDVALLYIHGGVNDDDPPEKPRSALTKIALATGTVVAELRMVPNQPLQFTGDTSGPRKEDRLIAYGWDRFLRGGDPVWLSRLPMTRSAVRAMDTITAFFKRKGENRHHAERHQESHPRVGRFVVAGASKRGWTTWTTAAVDKRVVAIIPLVIDLLNLKATFRHHFSAYGFWAPAIRSYVDMGIPNWFGTPEMRRLRKFVDPYEYRTRLTMPKLIINATGDQFFVPDSAQFYYDDLPGEKHLRYVPNADHSLRESDAYETVLAFYRAIVTGAPRPEFSWTFEPDGSISVRTAGPTLPAEARLWQATNPEKRDFRLETIGEAWRSTILTTQPDGEYAGRVVRPVSGWTAFFVELTYPDGEDASFRLTTEVRIVPDTLPFSIDYR
ncbi:MAG: PhoPQ-activated pathogenicity-related family protein [Acidobacteria bacterium]|nr:PhoPQ-activated pathogenicity-related family protein [Acidobacteriota bacterium]